MSALSGYSMMVKAYMPTSGTWVNITVPFDGLDSLPPAESIEAAILSKGYTFEIAGVEVGEKMEVMTHVLKRIHVNKDDGSKTPVLAFYHKEPKLKHKYDHVYMNTPEQIAEFEQLSGLKISDIPEYEGDNYIARDHAKAGKYIVALPKPVKVAAREEPYKFGDKEGTTMKIQRFIGASQPTATPDKIIEGDFANDGKWSTDDMASFWRNWANDKGYEQDYILKTLNVSKLSEWTSDLATANKRMNNAINKASGQ